MSKDPVELSDAEWRVMEALWAESPSTGRRVFEAVHGRTRWAYTTVCTMLSRLARKGIVGARKQKNVVIYTPRVTRDEARRAAVASLVGRAFGGDFAPLVQHLVPPGRLSKRDRERLAALLAALDDGGGAR
jgi:BlaI family penicillinase repressor